MEKKVGSEAAGRGVLLADGRRGVLVVDSGG